MLPEKAGSWHWVGVHGLCIMCVCLPKQCRPPMVHGQACSAHRDDHNKPYRLFYEPLGLFVKLSIPHPHLGTSAGWASHQTS